MNSQNKISEKTRKPSKSLKKKSDQIQSIEQEKNVKQDEIDEIIAIENLKNYKQNNPFKSSKNSVLSNKDIVDRTIIIDHFSNSLTKSQIKKSFAKFGKILKIHMIQLPKVERTGNPDVPQGDQENTYKRCYILYSSLKEAQNAQKVDNELDSPYKVHLEVDFNKSIFIKNLPKDVDDESLRKYFKSCGEILSIQIRKDRSNQNSSVNALVEFIRSENQKNALLMNDKNFNQCILVVQSALSPESLEKSKAQKNQSQSQHNQKYAEQRIVQKEKKKAKQKLKQEISKINSSNKIEEEQSQVKEQVQVPSSSDIIKQNQDKLKEKKMIEKTVEQFTSTKIDRNQLDVIDIKNQLRIPQSLLRKKIKKAKKTSNSEFQVFKKLEKAKQKIHSLNQKKVFKNNLSLKIRRQERYKKFMLNTKKQKKEITQKKKKSNQK